MNSSPLHERVATSLLTDGVSSAAGTLIEGVLTMGLNLAVLFGIGWLVLKVAGRGSKPDTPAPPAADPMPTPEEVLARLDRMTARRRREGNFDVMDSGDGR